MLWFDRNAGKSRLLCWALLTLALMWGALLNRHPLLFPDSGVYISVAAGDTWPIDRSGFYGLWALPIVSPAPSTVALWIWIAAQCAVVAAILWGVLGIILPRSSGSTRLAIGLGAALLTSLPWHAGQIMPDALSGATVLLAWVAARRDPTAPGAPLLWLATIAVTLTHLTHLVLLAVAAFATIAAGAWSGSSARSLVQRALASAIAISLVVGAHIAANSAANGRTALSPVGSLFVFAALHEDGVIPTWTADHCGRDGPPRLCAIVPALPRDSQDLLWGAKTPLRHSFWRDRQARYQLVEEMDVAVRGAIRENPGAFAAAMLRDGSEQLLSFQPIDDDCSGTCTSMWPVLVRWTNLVDPALKRPMMDSRQFGEGLPKSLVRGATSPITALAMILLLPMIVLASRRRDEVALSILLAIFVALLANALVTGGLSDVHDRYQSRLAWLAPFAVLAIAVRWRSRASAE